MTQTLFTLEDLHWRQLRERRVLVRVDFNVPIDGGRVGDDSRLREALPTLRELLATKARLVLVSHRGRPKGRRDPELSLRPVAERLAELLDRPVSFAEDCVGERAERTVAGLVPGDVALLENLRFHAGETADDPSFAERLAALADVFVNDAFGTVHRAHASVVGVASRIDVKAAGRLLIRELECLGRLLDVPERPFMAILGGAKVEGKIETLHNLLRRLDRLILGGGMANTFLAAQGLELGASLVERDRLEVARDILAAAEEESVEVMLPSDLVLTDDLRAPSRIETAPVDAVPAGLLAADIGEATRRRYCEVLSGAATVFWNGPLGVFEQPPFDAGTRAVAARVGDLRAFTVVGGGETVAAVRRAGVAERLGHISTGGGAALTLLAGKVLPGVQALAKEG